MWGKAGIPNIPWELVLFNVDQCLFSRLKLTLHVTFVNRRKLPAKFPSGRLSQGKKACLSWSLIKCEQTLKDHYNLEMCSGTTKEIYPILFSLCSFIIRIKWAEWTSDINQLSSSSNRLVKILTVSRKAQGFNLHLKSCIGSLSRFRGWALMECFWVTLGVYMKHQILLISC